MRAEGIDFRQDSFEGTDAPFGRIGIYAYLFAPQHENKFDRACKALREDMSAIRGSHGLGPGRWLWTVATTSQ